MAWRCTQMLVAGGVLLAAPLLAAGQPVAVTERVEPADSRGPVETRWVDARREVVGLFAGDPRRRLMLEPVDQAVGDLDPLSQSLRHIEPGQARFPAHARMFRLRRGAPGMWSQLGRPELDRMQRDRRHTYRYQAPGVRAWVRQPSYLVGSRDPGLPLAIDRTPGRDGEYIEIIPADTVFDLIPPSRRRAGARAMDAPDNRIDYRIDTRIDGRVAEDERGDAGRKRPR